MLCAGEKWHSEIEASPSNREISQAFSPSQEMAVHCIMNTAGRELFVVAPSCRSAKIIAVYQQHIQALGCGSCSGRELQKFVDHGPQFFGDKARAAVESGEPGVLWSSGYVSEQISRSDKEQMERLLLGIRT